MKQILRYILLFLISMFFIVEVSTAQKITLKLADEAYNEFSWNEAIELYEYALKKDHDNTFIIRRLADCNRNIGNTVAVERWIRELIRLNAIETEDLFNLSMALKSNGKFNESEKNLKKYASMRPEDGRVQLQQSLLEYINFLEKDSSRFIVKSVPFNTRGSDWGAVYYDSMVVYASTGPPNTMKKTYSWDQLPFLNLYAVKMDSNGYFSKPQPFAPKVMSDFHDGPATFDPNTKRMYFNSNRQIEKDRNFKETLNLQIFYADFEDGEWVYKGGFTYNDSKFNLRHPCIDPTGNVLYFASDMPGGKGGNDIYWCRKDHGRWGQPINLEEINTEGEELFPFISKDGVLYFSSDGQGGLGGLDIYMATPDRGVFSHVENMGYPINSSKDDFSFTMMDDGESGFLSSNRLGGKGYDDIYQFEMKYTPVIIKGTVRDRENYIEIANAKVSLIDENSDTIEVVYTKEDGGYIFGAFRNRNYTVEASKEFFNTSNKEISTYNRMPNEKIVVDHLLQVEYEMIDLDEIEPLSLEKDGDENVEIIVVESINFDFDRYNINSEAAEKLDRLVLTIEMYPEYEIQIESHTDSRGSDEYNLGLSKSRALSTYEYLVDHGVDPLIIEYNGFGETQLLNQCDDGVECSDEEHAINRRSMIKLVRRGSQQIDRKTRSIFYF